MSLTQEQIEKISKNLSKLYPKNKEKLIIDINSIVWYINMLDDIDTTWVKPTVSVIYNENILREDIEQEKITNPRDLLGCSKGKIIWNQIALNDIMK